MSSTLYSHSLRPNRCSELTFGVPKIGTFFPPRIIQLPLLTFNIIWILAGFFFHLPMAFRFCVVPYKLEFDHKLRTISHENCSSLKQSQSLYLGNGFVRINWNFNWQGSIVGTTCTANFKWFGQTVSESLQSEVGTKKSKNIFFDSLCGFVRYLSYPESYGWVRAGKVNKGTP